MDKFQLRLCGEFCLNSPGSEPIRIPSKKGRALLALLATAENGERTRSWLMDHLWSQSLSQGNLRKELSLLRSLLGAFDLDPLPKDTPKEVVRLDTTCFDIDVRNPALKQEGDFLDGLIIPNESYFEEWLRETRAYFRSLKRPQPESRRTKRELKAQTSHPRLCIGIVPVIWDTRYVSENMKLILNDLMDRISRSLLYHGGIEIFDHRFGAVLPSALNANAAPQPHAQLSLRVAETQSKLVLTIQLMLSETSQVVCTRRNELELNGLSHLLEDHSLTTQLVAETVDEILFTLYRHTPEMMSTDVCNVLKLVNEAVTGMFELNFAGLDRARSILDSAAEALPESVIYAWRAYLSAHQVDDPRIEDFKQIQEEARYYASRAIEIDRYNPLVLSLLTHVHAFTLREFDIATDYMQQAKALCSDHVMTYDADALLNLYLGNLPQSRQSALQAIGLGRFLPFRYIFYTSLCMIEALTGKYDSAIRAGEKSLRLQPASSNRPYPPTVRYLAESYARRGKKDKAFELINRLRHTDNHSNINHRAVPTLQIGDFLKISQESAYPVVQDYGPFLLT